jgi:hypothetical protein
MGNAGVTIRNDWRCLAMIGPWDENGGCPLWLQCFRVLAIDFRPVDARRGAILLVARQAGNDASDLSGGTSSIVHQA